jgi:hypothetical protein
MLTLHDDPQRVAQTFSVASPLRSASQFSRDIGRHVLFFRQASERAAVKQRHHQTHTRQSNEEIFVGGSDDISGECGCSAGFVLCSINLLQDLWHVHSARLNVTGELATRSVSTLLLRSQTDCLRVGTRLWRLSGRHRHSKRLVFGGLEKGYFLTIF